MTTRSDMQAVCTLKGTTGSDWHAAQKLLGESGLVSSLLSLDKDHISDAAVRQMRKVAEKPEGTPRSARQQNKAAGAFGQWITALEKYHVALQTVIPLREAIPAAEESLRQVSEQLAASKAQLQVMSMIMHPFCCACASCHAKHPGVKLKSSCL